jgi:hypothetical protein
MMADKSWRFCNCQRETQAKIYLESKFGTNFEITHYFEISKFFRKGHLIWDHFLIRNFSNDRLTRVPQKKVDRRTICETLWHEFNNHLARVPDPFAINCPDRPSHFFVTSGRAEIAPRRTITVEHGNKLKKPQAKQFWGHRSVSSASRRGSQWLVLLDQADASRLLLDSVRSENRHPEADIVESSVSIPSPLAATASHCTSANSLVISRRTRSGWAGGSRHWSRVRVQSSKSSGCHAIAPSRKYRGPLTGSM